MDQNTARASTNLRTQITNYKNTGTYSGGKTLGELGYKNGLPGFDPSDFELQTIARAAYDHDPKVEGYTFVPSLSDYETKVFVRPGTDVVVVSFKGTDPTNVDDIYTDIGLAAGHLSDSARTQRSRASLERVREAMPGSRVIVTGHSLGGSLAREVSNDPMVKRAVGFNTGYEIASTGLLGSMMKATAPYHKKNHADHPKFEDYLNSNDVISIGARKNKKDKHTFYKTRSFNKHKASYYK